MPADDGEVELLVCAGGGWGEWVGGRGDGGEVGVVVGGLGGGGGGESTVSGFALFGRHLPGGFDMEDMSGLR